MIHDNNLKSVDLENGLKVSIDYLSFTITDSMSVIDVIEFMGFNPLLFEDMPRGANGYKHMMKCPVNGISILYDGNEDMGIHVNVTGQGIAPLLEAFQETLASDTPFGKGYDLWGEIVLSHFIHEVLEIGHFSRIDTAIDDFGANYYTPDNVFALYQQGKIVSKWRTAQRNDNWDFPNQCSGYTLYLGSRSSTLFLRIYDKKLEQNGKKSASDNNYIVYDWIRWELQFKDERANELASQLINCNEQGVGKIVVGILSYYFRIIQLDDTNRSRCSNEEKWNEFIGTIDKLRLCISRHQKTIAEKELWVQSQVAPSLALLLFYHNGESDFLNDMALKALPRISPSDKERLRIERPDIYKQYFISDESERI